MKDHGPDSLMMSIPVTAHQRIEIALGTVYCHLICILECFSGKLWLDFVASAVLTARPIFIVMVTTGRSGVAKIPH